MLIRTNGELAYRINTNKHGYLRKQSSTLLAYLRNRAGRQSATKRAYEQLELSRECVSVRLWSTK